MARNLPSSLSAMRACGDVVTALRVAEEVIGAVRRPLHILAELLGGKGHQRIFAIGKQPRAETTADIGTDHAHLVLGHLQHVIAEDVAQTMAALAADGQRHVIALGVVFTDRRAGLHIVDDDARIDDLHFGDHGCLGEHRIDRLLVADRHIEQHIAGMLGPHLRRALGDGIDQTVHGRQRLPVDLDRLNRIARLRDSLRNHEGHGVADMADFPGGEDRIIRPGERMILEIEQAGQTAEILGVLRRQNRSDTRKCARLARHRW